MDVDNVIVRAAASSLTAAQVAQRQRDMMSSQVQSFDAAFGGSTQAASAGATGTGTRHAPWLYGVGSQFASHSSGLSGERRGAANGRVRSVS